MLDYFHENQVLFVQLVFILKLMLMAFVAYDIIIFSLGRERGKVLMEWRSSPVKEAMRELKYIVTVTLTFGLIFIMENSPNGRTFTPLPSLVLTILVPIGWLYILVVPKRYVITTEGILVKGAFYQWRDIKDVIANPKMDYVRLDKTNPLIPPSYIVTDDPRKVEETVRKAMKRAEKSRRPVFKLPATARVKVKKMPASAARPKVSKGKSKGRRSGKAKRYRSIEGQENTDVGAADNDKVSEANGKEATDDNGTEEPMETEDEGGKESDSADAGGDGEEDTGTPEGEGGDDDSGDSGDKQE